MSRLSRMEWHGYEAWQLDNDALTVVIVPALGAKIASLVDKPTGDEWLAAPTRPIRLRTYGDTFTDHDLSGWDEMFPTIDACPMPGQPVQTLPDHGEVWALPWDMTEEGSDSIQIQVVGRALPYRLSRRATLEQDHLRLDYQLDNLGSTPFPFLWAAHPLFNAGADCQVVLPESVRDVVNVVVHPVLGAADTLLTWPIAHLPGGADKSINVVGSADLRDYRKVYAPPEPPIGEGWLQRGQRQLHMSWPTDIAPYLGIWIDEGTYTRTPTVALEPATGYYDGLDKAVQNGRVTVAPVGQPVRWWITLRFEGRPAL